MDDISNILYLVLLAVSLIAGIWQNANKNKKAESSRPAPAYPDANRHGYNTEVLEDDLEEAMEQKRQADERAAKRLKEMAAKANKARGDRRIRRRKAMLQETSDSLASTSPGSAFDLSEFDAKKAIIYSEILNPPYL